MGRVAALPAFPNLHLAMQDMGAFPLYLRGAILVAADYAVIAQPDGWTAPPAGVSKN